VIALKCFDFDDAACAQLARFTKLERLDLSGCDVNDKGYSVPEMIGFFVLGLFIWTLTEYWLHRLVFHWEPDNAFGRLLRGEYERSGREHYMLPRRTSFQRRRSDAKQDSREREARGR